MLNAYLFANLNIFTVGYNKWFASMSCKPKYLKKIVLVNRKECTYPSCIAANVTYFNIFYALQLNVCGSLSAAGCDKVENHAPSLCHVYPNGTKEGLTFDPYTLDYSDDGKLLLKYEGKRFDDGERTDVYLVR